MGHLSTTKPPSKYNPAYMMNLVEKIRSAYNFLGEANFPEGLMGTVLKDGTVAPSKLTYKGEFHLPLVALATAFSTTSTSWTNCSPHINFDPVVWGPCDVYLELTAGPLTAGYQADFRLIGAGNEQLCLVNLTTVGLNWSRTKLSTVPSTPQTVLLQMKSNNASYSAGLMGARLVIVQK